MHLVPLPLTQAKVTSKYKLHHVSNLLGKALLSTVFFESHMSSQAEPAYMCPNNKTKVQA